MNKQEKLELKQKRKEQALEHNKMLLDKYTQEIAYSEVTTKVYTPETVFGWQQLRDFYPSQQLRSFRPSQHFNIKVIDTDTVSAILNCDSEHVQVLNFASYKNPGGRYMDGSMAQEEAICHGSSLFPVLSYHLLDYYEWNKKHLNKALYLNRGLYSPDILFFDDKENFKKKADVITVAAPNFSPGKRYGSVSAKENSKVLRDRIQFVLDIAVDNFKGDGNSTLILGAYGCGVFSQNPYEVATIFKEFLSKPEYQVFDNVVFAIPSGKNLDTFREVFSK